MESLIVEICFSGWCSALRPIAELTIDSEAAAGPGVLAEPKLLRELF